MVRLRALAQAMGVDTSGRVSLARDLFGFSRGRAPTDPTPAVAQASALELVRAVRGPHIEVNVIQVGFDTIPGGATQLDQAWDRVDYAVLSTRTIYRQAGLGVGRIMHWTIPAGSAGGFDDLGSEDEADELIESWSVPNGAVDAFMVRNISDTFVGKAADIPGSCDKDDKDDGVVAGEIGRPAEDVARTFAHEIGHHLGLTHNHEDGCPGNSTGCNNLMAQTRCATMCGGGTRVAVLLTPPQGAVMQAHCAVRPGLPV